MIRRMEKRKKKRDIEGEVSRAWSRGGAIMKRGAEQLLEPHSRLYHLAVDIKIDTVCVWLVHHSHTAITARGSRTRARAYIRLTVNLYLPLPPPNCSLPRYTRQLQSQLQLPCTGQATATGMPGKRLSEWMDSFGLQKPADEKLVERDDGWNGFVSKLLREGRWIISWRKVDLGIRPSFRAVLIYSRAIPLYEEKYAIYSPVHRNISVFLLTNYIIDFFHSDRGKIVVS